MRSLRPFEKGNYFYFERKRRSQSGNGGLCAAFTLSALLDDRRFRDAPESRSRARSARARFGVQPAILARATGFARSTISMAIAELRRERVIVESPQDSATRRESHVELDAQRSTFASEPGRWNMHRVASVTASSVHIMLADVSHSVICERMVRAWSQLLRQSSAVTTVRRAEIVRKIYTEAGSRSAQGLLGVGIAFSGPVAPDGRIHRASIIPTWAGMNIRDVFEPTCSTAPIFADNESNCAALAEMTWGIAVGCDDFLLFKIDIGVGGAIVSNGQRHDRSRRRWRASSAT